MPATTTPTGKPSPATEFKSAKRVQVSFVTAAEKKALAWFAARMPAWVSSDHLTILGFAGQLMVGASYALARYDHRWLLWGIFFLAVNWFGDSLDGTLARYRNQQRPRYGFYVDHVIDAIGATVLVAGLAFSGLMTPILSLALLISFLLLSIEVYLATYTMGSFNLAFFHLGPTELRILLAICNVIIFVNGPWRIVAGHAYLVFDIGALFGIAGMGTMFVYTAVKHTVQLYREERLP